MSGRVHILAVSKDPAPCPRGMVRVRTDRGTRIIERVARKTDDEGRRLHAYAKVYNGTALQTTGGLRQKDLSVNKHGKIVSKRKSAIGKKLYSKLSVSEKSRRKSDLARGRRIRDRRSGSKKSVRSSRKVRRSSSKPRAMHMGGIVVDGTELGGGHSDYTTDSDEGRDSAAYSSDDGSSVFSESSQ
jgi:hypothetical protein